MARAFDGIAYPVLQQRYEQVAANLEAEIAAGALRPGDRLPSERELAERLGVSRATVREALGALQVSGVVETRRGAGSYVVQAPARASIRALPTDASPSGLLEARTIFEPQIAGLAAQSERKDPELDRLLEVMAESSDPEDPEQRKRWSDADRAFHRQVALGTHNVVLVAIADYVADIMDQPLWRRLRDESIAAPGHTTLYLAEHRLIAAAIDEGDRAAAEFYVAQHLRHTRQYMALND